MTASLGMRLEATATINAGDQDLFLLTLRQDCCNPCCGGSNGFLAWQQTGLAA
jgi:hypothetical protein